MCEEEPILILIECISECCPEQDEDYSDKFLPDGLDIELDRAEREIQERPAEEHSVEHKGLENDVGERGLAAEGGSRVAHPHKGRDKGEDDDRRLYRLKAWVELSERCENGHQRTDMEGELMYCYPTAVAIREGHKKEVRYIESYRDIGIEAEELFLRVLGAASEYCRYGKC